MGPKEFAMPPACFLVEKGPKKFTVNFARMAGQPGECSEEVLPARGRSPIPATPRPDGTHSRALRRQTTQITNKTQASSRFRTKRIFRLGRNRDWIGSLREDLWSCGFLDWLVVFASAAGTPITLVDVDGFFLRRLQFDTVIV
jgi:hypothetical protein